MVTYQDRHSKARMLQIRATRFAVYCWQPNSTQETEDPSSWGAVPAEPGRGTFKP